MPKKEGKNRQKRRENTQHKWMGGLISVCLVCWVWNSHKELVSKPRSFARRNRLSWVSDEYSLKRLWWLVSGHWKHLLRWTISLRWLWSCFTSLRHCYCQLPSKWKRKGKSSLTEDDSIFWEQWKEGLTQSLMTKEIHGQKNITIPQVISANGR